MYCGVNVDLAVADWSGISWQKKNNFIFMSTASRSTAVGVIRGQYHGASYRKLLVKQQVHRAAQSSSLNQRDNGPPYSGSLESWAALRISGKCISLAVLWRTCVDIGNAKVHGLDTGEYNYTI